MVLFSFPPAALGQVTAAELEVPAHPDCPGSAQLQLEHEVPHTSMAFQGEITLSLVVWMRRFFPGKGIRG